MATSGELRPEAFFVSRAWVCVHVTLGKRNIRVQFESSGDEGKVAERRKTEPCEPFSWRALHRQREVPASALAEKPRG